MSGSGPTSKADASAARAFVVNSLAARAQSVGEIERWRGFSPEAAWRAVRARGDDPR